MSSNAIHRFYSPTTETELLNSILDSNPRVGEIVQKLPKKPPVSTTRISAPAEFFRPENAPKPGPMYRDIARRILAGERVEVECPGNYSVMRIRSAVRAHVEKAGREMISTKMKLTLWMELK